MASLGTSVQLSVLQSCTGGKRCPVALWPFGSVCLISEPWAWEDCRQLLVRAAHGVSYRSGQEATCSSTHLPAACRRGPAEGEL